MTAETSETLPPVSMRSVVRLAALLFGFAGTLATNPAHAQRTGEEWMSAHLRDASLLRAAPRGAIPLLRARQLRDHVDPLALLERVHAFASDGTVPPARRALALHVEAEVRRDLGQSSEAEAITRGLGYMTRWAVVGPFDNEGRAGFGQTLAPENDPVARIDTTDTFDGKERPVHWRWFPPVSTTGYVSLDAVVRPSVNACAFAASNVVAPRPSVVTLWLGATGAISARLNGTRVFSDDAVRRAWPDRAGVTVRLRQGANRLLLKVCTDDRGAGFFARFTRPDGTPATEITTAEDLPAVAADPPPRAGTPVLPPTLGVMNDLRRASGENAPAQAVEDYARYLALTGSDDPAAPVAADMAERAARAAPTAARWLLLADLTTDRNRRLEALRRAYAIAPGDPHVLAAVGHERRVGVYAEECVPYLEEAIRRDEGFLLPQIEHALFLDGVGLPLAARAELEALAVRAPRAVALLRARIAIAEHGGQSAEAQRLRRALLRLRHNDVENHESLARDARQQGDRESVRRIAERMLTARPDMLSVYTTAAELFESVGDGDRAVGTLARAVEIAPDEAGLWSAKGDLEARLGRQDDARTSMRFALSLRPQDATLRHHLEALEPATPRPDEALAESTETLLGRRTPSTASATTSDYNVRSLQELTVRTVYPNGLSGMFRQVAYEVRNDQGARDGRTYAMQYDPLSQRFELRAAVVHHADGTRDESAQLDEFDVNSDPSTRMYFSNRVVQVSFPRLTPGDVVEVRWRVDDVSSRNNFADYFGDLEIAQAEVPRAHYAYVLRAPPARRFYVHVAPIRDARPIERTETVEGDTKVYRFEARDVPAVAPDDHAPGQTERAAYIHLSTYQSWEDVGRWYWGLVRDQLVADDRIRDVVRTITRGLTTDRDKVRAIYNWVISHTRYVALEFGIHGFKPYLVPQICTRGFGDCKDKASVIVTMLREAGIEANMVLLRTRRNGLIEPTPASLAVFDHAIAYVPSLDLFLDGTAQHSGMDELPGGDQGVMALLVDRNGQARLVRTPVYTPERNTSTVRSELTILPSGGANLRVAQELRGPNAGGARSTLEAQATRAERIEDNVREHLPGVHVTSVRTGDLTDVEQAARFEYEATVPSIGTRQGPNLLFSAVSPLDLTRQYATRSHRTLDLIVGVPSTLDETRTIRLPPGATVSELPPPARIESPFGRLEFTVENRQGTLAVRRVVVLARDRITTQEYSDFRAFAQSVDDALARRVTLRMPGSAEEGAAR